MIAVDTNILVYSHKAESPWHQPANRVLSELVEGTSPWAIPWPCVFEFTSVVTNPRIYQPPSTLGDALLQIEAWLVSPSLVLLSETADFFSTAAAVLRGSAVVGARVHDARIAALCLHHGVTTLYSADRDFSRFGGLHTQNPLVVAP
jgi:toxin-antitoxin system PIN domain toxin